MSTMYWAEPRVCFSGLSRKRTRYSSKLRIRRFESNSFLIAWSISPSISYPVSVLRPLFIIFSVYHRGEILSISFRLNRMCFARGPGSSMFGFFCPGFFCGFGGGLKLQSWKIWVYKWSFFSIQRAAGLKILNDGVSNQDTTTHLDSISRNLRHCPP